MNNKLQGQIKSQIKRNDQFVFELVDCGDGNRVLDYNELIFPQSFNNDFKKWVYENFLEFLLGQDLYNSCEFKFELLNDDLYINCNTSLRDFNNENIYPIQNVLTEKVLKLLFNKNADKSINVDDILIQFEYEYDYSSNIWGINLFENSSHYIDGIEEFDFSVINTPKIKELIHLNIKDFKHNDCEPFMKYSYVSKYIFCQDSRIELTEYINIIIPVSDT